MDLTALLEECPVIAAIKDETGLKECLSIDKPLIFVLYGSVVSIPDIVARLKAAGKTVFVDIDLLDGLAAREGAVDYLHRATDADGVISTRASLVRRAAGLGMGTIYRTFLLDSMALASLERSAQLAGPDCIEILPGLMPKMIAHLACTQPRPVIASGLIADKEDVLTALGAGAAAISSTNPAVWAL